PIRRALLLVVRKRITTALQKVPYRLIRALRSRLDLENSIRFDMAIELGPEYQPGIRALTKEIVDRGDHRPKPSTVQQIERTISAVGANLFRAYMQDPARFVGISMGPQYYTRNRYVCQGIGFGNLVKVIEYMRDRRPPLISYHVGG